MRAKSPVQTAHPSSLIMMRVGGVDVPAVSIRQCKTCQHPERLQIETLLTQGYGYSAVSRRFEGNPPWYSIRDHYKQNHMPLGQATLRRLSENRTQELGAVIDEAADQIVDHVVVAKGVLHRGFERLVSGAIQPDVKETLAAAKLVKEIEDAANGGMDQQAWSEAFVQFFETARAVMSDEQYRQFGLALSANPILKAIEARTAEASGEIPGEVVGDSLMA